MCDVGTGKGGGEVSGGELWCVPLSVCCFYVSVPEPIIKSLLIVNNSGVSGKAEFNIPDDHPL